MSYFIVFLVCFLMLLLVISQSSSLEAAGAKNRFDFSWLKTFMFFSPLFLMTAFRNINVGIDTMQYYYLFNNVGITVPISWSEPVFYYVMIFLRGVGVSFSDFIFVQAFFYYLVLSSLITILPRKNHLAYVMIVATIFLYHFGMSGMRQSFAISLVLLSIFSLLRGKYITYFGFAIVAFGVHNSSIIPFLLMFLAHHIELSDKRFIIGLAVSPVFSFFNPSFLIGSQNIAIKQLSKFDSESVQLLSVKIPISIWFFTLFISFLMIYGNRLRIVLWDPVINDNFPAKNLILFGTIYMNCFLWLATSVRLTDRVSFYFVPFFAILVAWILSSLKKTYEG
ncbi:MAG TPA: EpsG family protein, partial [Oligella sp.]|nr:EpsG family protein [Oligella sp.]